MGRPQGSKTDGKKKRETYEEVQLETGGEWAPNHAFVSVPFDEIVSVDM